MVRGSLASLADPPAESPSTIYSSVSAGSPDEQSVNLPGKPAPANADLRTVFLAFWAASRARRASIAFPIVRLASFGCSSSQSFMASLVAF